MNDQHVRAGILRMRIPGAPGTEGCNDQHVAANEKANKTQACQNFQEAVVERTHFFQIHIANVGDHHLAADASTDAQQRIPFKLTYRRRPDDCSSAESDEARRVLMTLESRDDFRRKHDGSNQYSRDSEHTNEFGSLEDHEQDGEEKNSKRRST